VSFAPCALGQDLCTLFRRIKRTAYERVKFQVTQAERDEYMELI